MTSFLERLRERMTGSLSRPAFSSLIGGSKTRHNIVTNRWDERVWEAARPSVPIDQLISDLSLGDEHRGGHRAPFDAAPELVRDVFMTAYKAAPQLADRRRIERDAYPARKIVEEMLASAQLRELTELTAGDPVLATVAVQAMAEQVREIIARIPPPPPPPQPRTKPEEPQSGQDQHGEEQGAQEPARGPGEAADEQADDPGEDGDGEGGEEDLTEDAETGDFDPDGEDAQAEADWQDAYDELLEEADIDRAIHRALEAANKEAGDLTTARRGIGLDDGQWQAMSAQERLRAVERLRTPDMRALADAIGRMKRFALGVKATRIVDVAHEAFDVETGNDLRRVLAGQFALLGTPEARYEFYRRYAMKELLQYKLRGHENAGKGPIVCCIDKSGSMNGQPFMWAMAVSEALRRFASEEDRDFHALIFGTNADRHRFEFPQGKGPFEQVLAFLSCKADGGTAFDGVLTEAQTKCTTSFDGEGRGKADIVFITDGLAKLSDEWISGFNAERARTGVRVFSIYIGGARDMLAGKGPVGLLNRFSDAVISVKDLNPAAAKDVFAAV